MFYVLEVTQTKQADGTVKTEKGVYNHETQAQAVQSFHSRIGGQMKQDACISELVMAIGDDGAVYRSEKYVKPVEEEQPEK